MSVLAHRVSVPSIDTRNPSGTSVSLNAEEKTSTSITMFSSNAR